jgi:hypothetical protein
MIWSHVFNRVICAWSWRLLSIATWGKLPHIVAMGLVCVATWHALPLLPGWAPEVVPAAPAVIVWPAGQEIMVSPGGMAINAPEPNGITVFAVGIVALMAVRCLVNRRKTLHFRHDVADTKL